MAGWQMKGGMPDWHEISRFNDTLRDGTVITAETEDQDGDREYWRVWENGVLVARGEDTKYRDGDGARERAERVINWGATPEQRAEAAAHEQGRPF